MARITVDLEMKPHPNDLGICSICLGEKYLVTDHNHFTGMIRGRICDLCNSHLSMFERSYIPRKKRPYLDWEKKNMDRIEYHLEYRSFVPYSIDQNSVWGFPGGCSKR